MSKIMIRMMKNNYNKKSNKQVLIHLTLYFFNLFKRKGITTKIEKNREFFLLMFTEL